MITPPKYRYFSDIEYLRKGVFVIKGNKNILFTDYIKSIRIDYEQKLLYIVYCDIIIDKLNIQSLSNHFLKYEELNFEKLEINQCYRTGDIFSVLNFENCKLKRIDLNSNYDYSSDTFSDFTLVFKFYKFIPK